MVNSFIVKKRIYLTKIAIYICLISLSGNTIAAQETTAEQKKEWRKLYPKLNSKMARMEEILNFTDRFLDNEELKESVLIKLTEFIFLAQRSKNDIPFYLPKKEIPSYKNAIDKTAKLGTKLYHSIKNSDYKNAKKYLNSLDTLRRRSHSKWAE